jgi:hypothetical protein
MPLYYPPTTVSKMGNYTGDGTTNRPIAHGLQGIPSVVFTWDTNSAFCVQFKGLGVCTDIGSGNHGVITQMDGTNFYVGDSNGKANANGTNYVWVALG